MRIKEIEYLSIESKCKICGYSVKLKLKDDFDIEKSLDILEEKIRCLCYEKLYKKQK